MKINHSLLAFLVSIPCIASAQVVTNANFSTGGVLANQSSVYQIYDEQGAVPGWTFGSNWYGGVGVWNAATPPSDASFDPWAPMTPSTDGGQFGVLYEGFISQDISGFLPNTQYEVSFEIANMFVGYSSNASGRHAYAASMPVSLSDTVQGSLSTPVIGYPTPSSANESLLGPWSLMTLTFTTSSSVTPSTPLRLTFGEAIANPSLPHDSGSTTYGAQFALDAISVTPVPVPEASTSFSLLAAAGLYLNSRRRPGSKVC